MSAILGTRNLTKRFPGVTALDRVSFDLEKGEIHALCGENGAGKSTLIKTLSGIYPYGSYEGAITRGGQEVRFHGIADADRAGIAVIYQELALVNEMTVAENVFLGREPLHGGLVDWDVMYRETAGMLDHFKLDIDPAARVGDLGTGRQQLVEIVKALAKDRRILILDEPTAALTDSEVDILLNILRDLRKRGISCIYISHKLDEVFAIADRITVLRDGESVGTFHRTDTTAGEVIGRMVGRKIDDLFPRRISAPGSVLMSVKGLCVDDEDGRRRLDGIAFEVRAGEVVGFGGLMGAGRTELLMHLLGAWGTRVSGVVRLDEREFRPGSATAAVRAGVALVTEDRKRLGLNLDHDIGFNLSLSSLEKISHVMIDRNAEVRRNREMMELLRIKAPSLETITGTLSGGNQQKVVLGKALLAEPTVILLDEPTRGIDVGAKIEVYEFINRLTDEGRGVILVSSELPELIGMSDRIVMLCEGRVGGTFERSEATQERLLAAAIPKRGTRNDS
jgi:D-xylose transport system ATP-binding protein